MFYFSLIFFKAGVNVLLTIIVLCNEQKKFCQLSLEVIQLDLRNRNLEWKMHPKF